MYHEKFFTLINKIEEGYFNLTQVLSGISHKKTPEIEISGDCKSLSLIQHRLIFLVYRDYLSFLHT